MIYRCINFLLASSYMMQIGTTDNYLSRDLLQEEVCGVLTTECIC